MADDIYSEFDLFERKMDDAIGDLGNIEEEAPLTLISLLDVKRVLPRPPHFDVDDSGPLFGNPFDPNRCPGPPPPVFDPKLEPNYPCPK